MKQEDLEERLHQMQEGGVEHTYQVSAYMARKDTDVLEEPVVREKGEDSPARHNSPRTPGNDLKTESSISSEGVQFTRYSYIILFTARAAPRETLRPVEVGALSTVGCQHPRKEGPSYGFDICCSPLLESTGIAKR